uniref:subtilisin n=1 Tax=Globisporangium ultimum (strain ATCC 200006 / CBS 805.95 / DAOM BR144) TaxID=431595 RepID=K3WRP0_GLOUD
MNVRFATFLAAIAVAVGSADAAARVHPSVHRALRQDGTVDLIVRLAQTTESTLESIQEAAFSSRTAKVEAVKSKLQEQSKVASAEVESLLSKEASGLHGGYKNFWISNQVSIKGASFELVTKLAGLASVAEIREEEIIFEAKPIADAKGQTNELVGQEWGIKRIGANKIWADGNIGQGVIVGSIDSGVRGTHEALSRNFLGSHGWFDAENQTALSYDISGHGTHTMGTIAGSHGVGVAPGATWLTCKGSRIYQTAEGPKVGFSQADLNVCAQFILCPTKPDGSDADCSKAPRVVNNSWGGAGGRNFFDGVIDAWIKAGIVPVFSQGNSGPECSTAGSPGDNTRVIGVGATGETDNLAWFSSKGPSLFGRRKPDISAPGFYIRSSYFGSDNDYQVLSGTSMAAPHVAGSIALLLATQPDLAIDEVKVALYTTTDQKGLQPSNYTCGGTSDAAWPNNQWGHGRLNILNAYEGFRPAP